MNKLPNFQCSINLRPSHKMANPEVNNNYNNYVAVSDSSDSWDEASPAMFEPASIGTMTVFSLSPPEVPAPLTPLPRMHRRRKNAVDTKTEGLEVENLEGAVERPQELGSQLFNCTCRRKKAGQAALRTACRVSCYCRVANAVCGEACGCRGSCSQGLSTRLKVEVKASLIPGAGEGCFALDNIRNGFIIDEYKGLVQPYFMAEKKTKSVYIADLESPREDGRHLVVDGEAAKLYSPCTRANHSKDPNAYAMKMRSRLEGNTRLAPGLFLIASKNIQTGEEITWDYGENYDTSSFTN